MTFARGWHVFGEHFPLDEFNPDVRPFTAHLKTLFYASNFYPLLDFIEHALRSPDFPDERKLFIAEMLERCRAGWRIVGDQVVPFGSEEEANYIGEALNELGSNGKPGVKSHLRNSALALSKGTWADSVRESIHAVEAAARAFDENKTLGEIVRTLSVSGKPLHPALIKSLSAVYGYAGDEKGIRHSLVEDTNASVGEDEALLLYGLSVSFARYLVRLRAAA